jgi:S1-C subfamily serine protease
MTKVVVACAALLATLGVGIGSAAAATRDVVARVLPSVVVVETSDGSGSGFAYGSRGEFLTNAHVVGDDETVTLVAADGRRSSATVIALDGRVDVALLRAELAPRPLGAAEEPVLAGDDVLAVGAPRGLQGTVTKGIVSSVGRDVGGVGMLQTDLAVNPGNSGGPLLTTNGEVLGVITLKSAIDEGVAFAVPIATATEALEVPSGTAPRVQPDGAGFVWLLAAALGVGACIVLVLVLRRRIASGPVVAAEPVVLLRRSHRETEEPAIVLRRRPRAMDEQELESKPTQPRSEGQWI